MKGSIYFQDRPDNDTFPLAHFFYMWNEGLCAHKQIPYQQPFAAAYPKETA